MIRYIFLLVALVFITSCGDKNKSNTTYTFIIDHYSKEIDQTTRETLSIEEYSYCKELSTSTYNSKVIRYDIDGKNEVKILRKPLLESIFPSKLKPAAYTRKIDKFNFPNYLKADKNLNPDTKQLELYINTFNQANTKVLGLNSLGLEYKNLQFDHTINHFQNIYDLKDALSDYICNNLGEKNVIILLNLFNDTSIDDCLARCEDLPEDSICADDGNTYRNIECMKCYGNLKEISCDKGIPIFKRELLTDKAFEIFYQFAEAQELIANDKNISISNDLINNTLRLFDSDNTTIEILNLGTRKPIEFSTRAYLRRLKNRPFDQIAIEWNQDWTVVDDWTDAGEEIPQSEMTAKGRQVFKGYRKNLIAYSDAIDKNVNFQAKLVETIDEDGNEVLEWKVFIGDITIASDPTSL